MTEHALLIPTAAGPVGAVVHLPNGRQRGALVLLQGLGPSARAGVNALYTRIARDLASLGLVVLRFDMVGEGDSALAGRDVDRQELGWRRSNDLAVLREIAPWLLERTGEKDLLLAGNCHGARVALEFAAFDPVACGLFLIVPYLWHREPHRLGEDGLDLRPMPADGPVLSSDEDLTAAFRAARERGPVWVLLGQGEEELHTGPFAGRLAAMVSGLELEIAPGMPLHPGGHPTQQAAIRERLVRRVGAALVEREQPVAASP